MKTKKWGMCCEEQPTVDPETGRCQNGCGPKPHHTPTPWSWIKTWSQPFIIKANDTASEPHHIAQVDCDENAAYIVKAVNCHEELLKALEGMMEWARRVNSINPGNEILNASNALLKATDEHRCGDAMCESMMEECERQGIAKAEEK